MVNEKWRLKIADFDTARLKVDENSQTFRGKVVGSPSYMAPEMLNNGEYTARADVYSIGILTNELARRVVEGRYTAPYTERSVPNLAGGMGVLIYAAGAKQGRPVVCERTPALLRTLIEAEWRKNCLILSHV